jgi:hypothetical protein
MDKETMECYSAIKNEIISFARKWKLGAEDSRL